MSKISEEIKDCYSTNENGHIIPINLDFDGTMVTHEYPYIGRENEHGVEILKKWIEKYNIGIILHTSRHSKYLPQVLKWFEDRHICLWAIGTNPTQGEWTDTVKSYGFYIDDMCATMPLIKEEGVRDRVDWLKLEEIFTPTLEELIKYR